MPPPHCSCVRLSTNRILLFNLLLVWELPCHFICVYLCHTRIPSLNFVSICTNSAQCGFSNSCCIDDILVLFMSLQYTKFLCKRKSISVLHFTFTSTTTGCATAQLVTHWPVTTKVRINLSLASVCFVAK
jgi:hypothetical protein